MAEDSRAELLVQNVITTLEGLGSGDLFTTVERKKLGLDDLDNVATTQMPYCAVTSGLPDAEPKRSGRTVAVVDKFQSTLTITLTVYGLDNVTPDATILSMVDDMWSGLFADPSRGGLALSTTLLPELETDILDPYYVFAVDVEIVYVHTRAGI